MICRLASSRPSVAPFCHVAPVQNACGAVPDGHRGFASRKSDGVQDSHAVGLKSHGCPPHGLQTPYAVRSEQA